MNQGLIEKNPLNYENFDPTHIEFQDDVIDDVTRQFDYNIGAHEVLLSGSVGSAKSVLGAHLAVRHCLTWPKSRGMISRVALPDLKDTLYTKILEQVEGCNVLKAVQHINRTSAKIKFVNGSEIIARTCHDKNYTKVRSLELSFAIFEEAIEFGGDHWQFITETRMRVGRLPNILENWILYITNPDDPDHALYSHFELEKDEQSQVATAKRHPLKHVYYSHTDKNPFLSRQYIRGLYEQYDSQTIERMVKGRWVYLKTAGMIYFNYSKSENYTDATYKVDERLPIHVCWDFNVSVNNPLSVCFMQCDPLTRHFHVFDEVIIEQISTEMACDEMAHRGLLDYDTDYIINGDAAGRAKSTKSLRSDYDIINKFFLNYKVSDRHLKFRMHVPISNPAIRARHNAVRGVIQNALKQRRLTVYGKAKTVDKGLRLTQLKDSANYLELEKYYTHVITALGYGVVSTLRDLNRTPQGSRQL